MVITMALGPLRQRKLYGNHGIGMEKSRSIFYGLWAGIGKVPLEGLLDFLLFCHAENRPMAVFEYDSTGLVVAIENIRSRLTEAHTTADIRAMSENALSQLETTTLSNIPFSDGLQTRLVHYNAELQFLTITQVQALEASLRYQHLWIQGARRNRENYFCD